MIKRKIHQKDMRYIAFFLISISVSPVYANQPKVDLIDNKGDQKGSQNRYPKVNLTVKSSKNSSQNLLGNSQTSLSGTEVIALVSDKKAIQPSSKSKVDSKARVTPILRPNIVFENSSFENSSVKNIPEVIQPTVETKQSKFSFSSLKNKFSKSSREIDQPEVLTTSLNENVETSQIKPIIRFNASEALKTNKKEALKTEFKNDVNTESKNVIKIETLTKNNTINEENVVEPSNKKKRNLFAKDNIKNLFTPKSSDEFRKVQLTELSDFEYRPDQSQSLPIISGRPQQGVLQPSVSSIASETLTLNEAVKLAVSKHPEISQSISELASQNANIDVARSGYYPQLSAGVSTGDMTSAERGRQLLNFNATQMLFDFGKVKSSVTKEEAKLLASQAQVLVSIDQISLEVANTIVNIKRYDEVSRIAREQIKGISRISEIANLRAKAGISSQADPIQAQSYLEAAQSNLIVQETQLMVFKQRLRTLLGADISNLSWSIPDSLIARSDIYKAPEFNKIPQMMLAKAQADVASFEKRQTELSRYPTLNVKGTLSQALNGRNPNNNVDNGSDSAIMFEATSNFYQGGAVASQTRAASFAEEAAKARINAVYLETMDQIRSTQEQVENKQRQMKVLIAQKATTVRTKELYQEQYKLGTRTAVDLLNAEQAIHSANQQIETARYDIYENLVQYIAAAGKTRDVYQLNNLTIQGVELQP